MRPPRRRWLLLLAMVLVAGPFAAPSSAQDLQVTVVAIMASDQHRNIDPKLQKLAAEVRKQDRRLTGFRVDRTTSKPLTVGQRDTFPLVSDLTAEVTLVKREEKDSKVRLTVKAPHMGEVTYSTCYDKYFPMMTRYQNEKDKERLLLAVMVQSPAKSDKKTDK